MASPTPTSSARASRPPPKRSASTAGTTTRQSWHGSIASATACAAGEVRQVPHHLRPRRHAGAQRHGAAGRADLRHPRHARPGARRRHPGNPPRARDHPRHPRALPQDEAPGDADERARQPVDRGRHGRRRPREPQSQCPAGPLRPALRLRLRRARRPGAGGGGGEPGDQRAFAAQLQPRQRGRGRPGRAAAGRGGGLRPGRRPAPLGHHGTARAADPDVRLLADPPLRRPTARRRPRSGAAPGRSTSARTAAPTASARRRPSPTTST